jgi:hypothetical protein
MSSLLVALFVSFYLHIYPVAFWGGSGTLGLALRQIPSAHPMEKSLTYTSPSDLRERLPDSDLVELTTEGIEDPKDNTQFLDAAVEYAEGGNSDYTEAEMKVGDILHDALTHGEGRVNSRVGASYDLPAKGPDGTAPPEIQDAVLVLAEEKIRDRRPRRQKRRQGKPDITRRADEIRRWLRSVSNGNSIIARLDKDNAEEKKKSGMDSGTARRGSRQFSSGW